MKIQYLYLSVYACDKCGGPVASASLAVRENEISKKTDIREVGATCLACGHRQSKAIGASITRGFPPVEWKSIKLPEPVETTAGVALERVSRE